MHCSAEQSEKAAAAYVPSTTTHIVSLNNHIARTFTVRESDVCRRQILTTKRQILTTKVDPCTKHVVSYCLWHCGSVLWIHLACLCYITHVA